MINRFMQQVSKNILPILAMLLWVFLWVFPWAVWLEAMPWVRLGISILLFAAPGMLGSLLLAGKRFTLLGHFTSGLALSVFLIGLLGLIGRVFHLPFAFIKPVFTLTGLLGLLIFGAQRRSKEEWHKPQHFSIATLVLLSFMIILGVTVSFLYRFGIDDFSYLAYLTNWQHAQSLNFHEVFFNTGGIDSIRFWLAMFPMDQAFLSEISNLHGLLLLGYYLEPFLVIIAILVAYNLYEDLFQSEYRAITALLLQFTFLVLRAGAIYTGIIFFNRLSHDKAFAAFVLAPTLFLVLRYFLESFNLRSAIFLVLTGFSLALTHPVILAFSIFIASVYAGIVTIAARDYKKLGVAASLLFLIILLPASTRIASLPLAKQYIPALDSMQSKGAFDLEAALNTANIKQRISYIEGTPFYGFNLNVIKIRTDITNKDSNPLQIFFSWSYLWVLGLGFIWSLFNLSKKKSIAPFVAAASLLVLLSAIPYTGWLVGYFVSARLLLRSSWMLPVGLIGTVLLVELLKFTLYKMPARIQSRISEDWVAFGLILIISLASIGYFYTNRVSDGGWRSFTKLDSYRSELESLVVLGNYLENNVPSSSVFVASNQWMDYLPGLSSKSKVVFFRMPQFSRVPMNMGKVKSLILDPSASIAVEKRVNFLENRIQYVLTTEQPLKNYYASYPQFFDAQKIENFWIIKFRKSNP